MDKIIMKDMKFYGYHGILEEEKTVGQYFYIDADLYVDLKQAGISDNLDATVDYSAVFKIISAICEQKKFCLLEALGEKICRDVLGMDQRIKSIEITIKKPDAPIEGEFAWMGIQIKRER